MGLSKQGSLKDSLKGSIKVSLKGSIRDVWDLVSKAVSTSIGLISSYKYSYLTYNPSY